MKNFDPRWKSPEDYILGITYEIWEDRGINTLNQYYADDIVVRSPASVVVGNQSIKAATMATLAELPDRELLGEDVIWCDAPDGFLSSHRLVSTATHTHPGVYGAPTGKTIAYRILADCYCTQNQVKDEWLVRDQGAIVTQLGLDPKTYAAQLIYNEGGPEQCVKPLTPEIDVQGAYQGRGNDHPRGQQAAALLEALMAGEFSQIPKQFDRAAHLEYPNGQSTQGWKSADNFWMGLRSAFPDAVFTIHHQMGIDSPDMSPRSALRWSLHGKHSGWGRFGAPTQAEVYVMGITHSEYGPRGLRRGWTLIDETAIWKQILLHTG